MAKEIENVPSFPVGKGHFSFLSTKFSISGLLSHLLSHHKFGSGFPSLHFYFRAFKKNLLDEQRKRKRERERKEGLNIHSVRKERKPLILFSARELTQQLTTFSSQFQFFLYSRHCSHYPQLISVSNFILFFYIKSNPFNPFYY